MKKCRSLDDDISIDAITSFAPLSNSRGRSASPIYELLLSYRNDKDDRTSFSEALNDDTNNLCASSSSSSSFASTSSSVSVIQLPPPKLIVKLSQSGIRGRIISTLRNEWRECKVYSSNLLPKSSGGLMRVPRLVAHTQSHIFNESVLVLEHLAAARSSSSKSDSSITGTSQSHSHSHNHNRRCFSSNDILGALRHPSKYSREDQKVFLKLLARILASLHSRHWNSSTLLLDYPFIAGATWYSNVIRESYPGK